MAIELTPSPKNNPSVTINSYTSENTLKNVYQTLNGDQEADIPFMVWLLEDPKSFLPFPGKIDLCRHDYLHILLERGFSLEDESFIIGFTMGNDIKTKPIHCLIFKLISKNFYPPNFRFTEKHLQSFDLGFLYGRKVKIKNINNLDFSIHEDTTIAEIRKKLGIEMDNLILISKLETLLYN
ncbi:hypothetical protein [Nodularia sp. NIES-3585]|uniref:hypothetical protein n=1 Tax=Nodularia sp. NIES-3585 TaxID=1973477 RepID=UPI000B5C1DEC|nr:hypothetical protein [Nodularia sp. NIES-3585]GAX38667.1 hypothetical protein NIES3585_47170 [Nodularia sp. NIES-3585]